MTPWGQYQRWHLLRILRVLSEPVHSSRKTLILNVTGNRYYNHKDCTCCVMLMSHIWVCRVLEKVNFEVKFDQLPEFHPEKLDQTGIPQSPSLLLAGLRKKKLDGADAASSPLKSASSLVGSRFVSISPLFY